MARFIDNTEDTGQTAPAKFVIDALGDSTTFGYVGGSQSAKNMISAAQDALGGNVQINNLGQNSTTLSDLLSSGRLDQIINNGNPVVMLNYGMNEAYRGSDINQFKNDLASTVKRLQAAGKTVILQTPNNVNSKEGWYANVGDYAKAIKDVAASTNAPVQDKFSANISFNSNDATHPDVASYESLGKDLAQLLAPIATNSGYTTNISPSQQYSDQQYQNRYGETKEQSVAMYDQRQQEAAAKAAEAFDSGSFTSVFKDFASDPQVLALLSTALAPQLSGLLGGGMAGSAGAGAILGGVQAASTGQDILKGAVTGGIGGAVGSVLNDTISSIAGLSPDTTEAAFMQIDANRLADSGLSASQISDILGQQYSTAGADVISSVVAEAVNPNAFDTVKNNTAAATTANNSLFGEGGNTLTTTGSLVSNTVSNPIIDAVTNAVTTALTNGADANAVVKELVNAGVDTNKAVEIVGKANDIVTTDTTGITAGVSGLLNNSVNTTTSNNVLGNNQTVEVAGNNNVSDNTIVDALTNAAASAIMSGASPSSLVQELTNAGVDTTTAVEIVGNANAAVAADTTGLLSGATGLLNNTATVGDVGTALNDAQTVEVTGQKQNQTTNLENLLAAAAGTTALGTLANTGTSLPAAQTVEVTAPKPTVTGTGTDSLSTLTPTQLAALAAGAGGLLSNAVTSTPTPTTTGTTTTTPTVKDVLSGASTLASLLKGSGLAGLLGSGIDLATANSNANKLQDIFNTQANQITAAAAQQAPNYQFSPIGITTRFGAATPKFDANGKLIGYNYNAASDIAAQRDQLLKLSQQALPSTTDTTQIAQNYVAQQQGLLAPSQQQQLANIQARLAATGRSGLGTGATAATDNAAAMAATNPELAAYYNALAQTNAQIAANAPTYAQNLLQQQIGTSGLLSGQANTLEGYAQQPLTMGSQLGQAITAGTTNLANSNQRAALAAAELQAQGAQGAYALKTAGQTNLLNNLGLSGANSSGLGSLLNLGTSAYNWLTGTNTANNINNYWGTTGTDPFGYLASSTGGFTG